MTPVDLDQLPVISVDPDRWRQRHVAVRVRERGDIPALADMAGVSLRTAQRALTTQPVAARTLDRLELALDGWRTPTLTEQHIEYLRRSTQAFLNRISTKPIGVTT